MTAFTPNFLIPYQTFTGTFALDPEGLLGEDGALAVDAALAGIDSRTTALETAAAANARLQAVTTTGQNLAASSTTMQDVTGLSLPVVAATYAWRLELPYECTNNAPDIKVAFVFPSTSSSSYNFLALALGVTGSPPYLVNMGGGTNMISGTAFVNAGTVGLRASIIAYGHFTFTAAGTVKIQAAQNVSDVNVVTVHPGAQLSLNRA